MKVHSGGELHHLQVEKEGYCHGGAPHRLLASLQPKILRCCCIFLYAVAGSSFVVFYLD